MHQETHVRGSAVRAWMGHMPSRAGEARYMSKVQTCWMQSSQQKGGQPIVLAQHLAVPQHCSDLFWCWWWGSDW